MKMRHFRSKAAGGGNMFCLLFDCKGFILITRQSISVNHRPQPWLGASLLPCWDWKSHRSTGLKEEVGESDLNDRRIWHGSQSDMSDFLSHDYGGRVGGRFGTCLPQAAQEGGGSETLSAQQLWQWTLARWVVSGQHPHVGAAHASFHQKRFGSSSLLTALALFPSFVRMFAEPSICILKFQNYLKVKAPHWKAFQQAYVTSNYTICFSK